MGAQRPDAAGYRILLLLAIGTCIERLDASPWMKKDIYALQFNPQLYLLGVHPKCTQARTNLSPLQHAMCISGGYQDHMSSVNVGLQLALQECQHQFRNMRWNCSTLSEENILDGQGKTVGTREDSFIRSIAAAGVTYAVARGCRNGLMSKCGCSKRGRPDSLNKDWVWGGCGDNIEYAEQFASAFIDLREKEMNNPKKSYELSKTLMNKHNNEVGRKAVATAGDRITCKCHGASGSCSLKTCWEELPPFRDTGGHLKKRYDTAIQVQFNKGGTRLVNSNQRLKRYAPGDLIYLQRSPNFCDADGKLGSHGTQGRECNATSTGPDNCDTLCCGRGYNAFVEKVTERCQCKFVWCCYVQCETCEREVEKYICK